MTTRPDGTLWIVFLSIQFGGLYAFYILRQLHQVLDPDYLITLTWSTTLP